jgi:hypothetical protein
VSQKWLKDGLRIELDHPPSSNATQEIAAMRPVVPQVVVLESTEELNGERVYLAHTEPVPGKSSVSGSDLPSSSKKLVEESVVTYDGKLANMKRRKKNIMSGYTS